MSPIRWFAILCTLALAGLATLGAMNPHEVELGAVNHYALDGGGYVRLAVDELGRVEGYYERKGRFGRISGRLQGSHFQGYWASSEATTRDCEEPRDGSRRWGRLSWEWRSADEWTGFAGVCRQAPDESDRWAGRRQ